VSGKPVNGMQFVAPAPATPAAGAAPPPVPLGDPGKKTGIYALTKADIFNILCLPVDPTKTYNPTTILEPAAEFCLEQRAMLIVDPPKEWPSAGPLDFNTINTNKPLRTLNPLAVNALRTRPAVGPVIWGARTTVGADQAQNQWKYLPVRRLALYIEESLRRGTQWAVFEPNDEPLWSSLRLNVTTFMQGLFRQGAFEGSTPANAYVVQCDANNNPQDQIDLGIVNILVGFAPLYPAEFVIINIQQQAGQA